MTHQRHEVDGVLSRVAHRGPLAFPVTPYSRNGSLDESAFRRHVLHMAEYEPPAWFVACGTGEFAALDSGEISRLVQIVVEEVGDDAPVFGAAGHGVGIAKDVSLRIEDSGAKGVLLFPPTLLTGNSSGYVDFVGAVASCTNLEIVLYHRAPMPIPVECVPELTSIPSVVAIKEGLGDVETLTMLIRRAARGTLFLNGMPTAEVFQPALQPLGVAGYSSAVFNFVPEISWAFHRAVTVGDASTVRRLNEVFFGPFLEVRRRSQGFAISLVKTGARLRWNTPEAARPPLPVVGAEDAHDLSRIMEVALAEFGQ